METENGSRNASDPITRREFLAQGGGGCLSAACLLTPAALAVLQTACGKGSSPTGSAPGPATAIANSTNNIYDLTFSQFSALQSDGGSVHVSVAATSGTKDLFVTRINAGSAIAVSTVCTHQGCTLNTFDPPTQQYFCPCHSSTFNSSGAVTNGPATAALTAFSGTIGASSIQFTIP